VPEPRLRRQAAYSACERMNRHRASVRGPPHTVMWGQDSEPREGNTAARPVPNRYPVLAPLRAMGGSLPRRGRGRLQHHRQIAGTGRFDIGYRYRPGLREPLSEGNGVPRPPVAFEPRAMPAKALLGPWPPVGCPRQRQNVRARLAIAQRSRDSCPVLTQHRRFDLIATRKSPSLRHFFPKTQNSVDEAAVLFACVSALGLSARSTDCLS